MLRMLRYLRYFNKIKVSVDAWKVGKPYQQYHFQFFMKAISGTADKVDIKHKACTSSRSLENQESGEVLLNERTLGLI